MPSPCYHEAWSSTSTRSVYLTAPGDLTSTAEARPRVGSARGPPVTTGRVGDLCCRRQSASHFIPVMGRHTSRAGPRSRLHHRNTAHYMQIRSAQAIALNQGRTGPGDTTSNSAMYAVCRHARSSKISRLSVSSVHYKRRGRAVTWAFSIRKIMLDPGG